jgi:hypothetical protein
MPTSALLGRDAELRAVQQVVDGCGTDGRCQVLAGEPGIGRSTLLTAGRAAAEARGFRVLSVIGSDEERRLPYAGLHQLLLPLSAGGSAMPPVTDPYAVAVATVDLLLEASRTRPVLAVVDDLQWVDEESAAVIAFVGRRLGSHRLGLDLAASFRLRASGFGLRSTVVETLVEIRRRVESSGRALAFAHLYLDTRSAVAASSLSDVPAYPTLDAAVTTGLRGGTGSR